MIKSLPLTVVTLLMASYAFIAEAEVYKIVDSAGKVTYTDNPPADEGADQLRLPPINQFPKAKISAKESLPTDWPAFAGYSMVDLVTPLNDSVVRYDQQNIIVQLVLSPELQAGHLVQYYLDGAAYGRPLAATSYAIGNLERGSHGVSARVVTPEGLTVANSRSVVVHVQRHFKRD